MDTMPLTKEVFMSANISAKKFAYWGGIAMLVIGVLSMLPGLVGPTTGLPLLKVTSSYGAFLGMFPMNILNKLALIVFGIAGISVAKRYEDESYSITYSKVVLYVMGALALLGIPTSTDTLGGYWPLFGGEIFSHGVFALLGGYFGYAAHSAHTHTHTQHNIHDVHV
jgi:hypothetical protein